MLLDLGEILGGLVLLVFAGDRLVSFAVAVAEKARVTPAVIGLTIVAAGTSMPELFVSLLAAFGGEPDIAIGNVVGSNIFNVAFILGATALIAPIPIERNLLKLDYPFMVISAWIGLLLFRDGLVDRLESSFFTASIVAFTAYAVWLARRQVTAEEARELGELLPAGAPTLKRRPLWFLIAGLALCFVGLGLGSRFLVAGAAGLAQAMGVSERVIGLTIVAAGTSLPELVASVGAALKKEHAMAVANIVGSNIFNILAILGLSGLVQPIPVAPGIIATDAWVMLGVSVLLGPLLFTGLRLTRVEAGVLLAAYAGYLAYLFA